MVGDGFNGGVGMQTITYDLNGGEGRVPAPQNFQVGQVVTLAELNHQRQLFNTHHTFDGWVDPATDKLYAPGEKTNFTDSVVLYAKFTI